MKRAFKTKLMAAAFIPALALAASATYAAGDYKSPSADKMGTTQGSMKSGMTASTDATFDRLDVNHDGKLSASEAAADPKVHSAWNKLDVNNKGSVSKSEFEAHASLIK